MHCSQVFLCSVLCSRRGDVALARVPCIVLRSSYTVCVVFQARRCRVGAGAMAPGERARRLGAHARLACCVCGARARAVPSDRRRAL